MAKRRFSRARRYYRRARARASKMTIPVAAISGFIAAPSIQYAFNNLMAGNLPGVISELGGLAGIDPSTKKFSTEKLKQNALPIMAGLLVHKGASMLGVNRALASAKIPLLRV